MGSFLMSLIDAATQTRPPFSESSRGVFPERCLQTGNETGEPATQSFEDGEYPERLRPVDGALRAAFREKTCHVLINLFKIER